MGIFDFLKRKKKVQNPCHKCGVATHGGFSIPAISGDISGTGKRLYFCDRCYFAYEAEQQAKAAAYMAEHKKKVNEQKRTVEQLYEEALKEPNPYLLKDIEYPSDYPVFRFCPNPLITQSVEESSEPCECCGKVDKYSYVAGMQLGDLDTEIGNLCLWCIANGEAAKKFKGVFTEYSCIANRKTDKYITEEIMHRTPAFTTWQDPEWLSHCKTPCAYIGRVYIADLLKMGIYKQVRTELAKTFYYQQMPMTVAEIDDMLIQMVEDSSLEGQLFKCIVCGRYKMHIDID